MTVQPFADLKTAVSKRLLDENNTAVSADDIGDIINASIKFWKTKTFWFNEFSEAVTLTIADADIPEPSTITMLAPFDDNGLVISYAGQKFEVKKKRPHDYDLADLGQSGRPCIYTFRNMGWQCYFLPDQAYTATWYGLKDYPALSAAGETNDFLTYAQSLIKYDTLARCLVEFRQDSERAAIFDAGAQSEYENLTSLTNKITGTGVLAVATIL